MALLETKGLTIRFGGLAAVSEVDLKIEKGELYGLIGPNGAGKTTIFNLLTGVYQPTEGEIILDGKRIDGKKSIEINKLGIARTFQNIRLFAEMTVLENVMVGLHNKAKCGVLDSIFKMPKHKKDEKTLRSEAIELLKIFDLEHSKNFKARNLPYGQQRKLEIARAIATNPKLLLLDEPAAGMNPRETEELMGTVRFVKDKFGLTVLLIEHDIKFVSGICENATVLNFGTTLAQGKIEDVLKEPAVITAYLGE